MVARSHRVVRHEQEEPPGPPFAGRDAHAEGGLPDEGGGKERRHGERGTDASASRAERDHAGAVGRAVEPRASHFEGVGRRRNRKRVDPFSILQRLAEAHDDPRRWASFAFGVPQRDATAPVFVERQHAVGGSKRPHELVHDSLYGRHGAPFSPDAAQEPGHEPGAVALDALGFGHVADEDAPDAGVGEAQGDDVEVGR